MYSFAYLMCSGGIGPVCVTGWVTPERAGQPGGGKALADTLNIMYHDVS